MIKLTKPDIYKWEHGKIYVFGVKKCGKLIAHIYKKRDRVRLSGFIDNPSLTIDDTWNIYKLLLEVKRGEHNI